MNGHVTQTTILVTGSTSISGDVLLQVIILAGVAGGLGTSAVLAVVELIKRIRAVLARRRDIRSADDTLGPLSDSGAPMAPAASDPLTAGFAQHAQAVRRQVAQYADLLADGDAVLRARLRRFEDGTP